jgi:uncharacterized protein YdcH (DUF465 family)
LQNLAKAKRARLYAKDYQLPRGTGGPDDIRVLQDAISDLHEKLDAYEGRKFTVVDIGKGHSAEQLRIMDLESRLRAHEAKLRQIVEHSNKLVDAIKGLEDRIAQLEPKFSNWLRAVTPLALTTVEREDD